MGLTLEEVEAAEGGVVRESAVGMAQTKRAVKRKGSRAGKAGLSGATTVQGPYPRTLSPKDETHCVLVTTGGR